MNHPFIDHEFLVNWSALKVDSIEQDIDYALELAEERIARIEQLEKGLVTYENTADALETASDELDLAWSIVEHLTNVMDRPELREVYKKVLPRVTDFYSGIALRPQLWQAVKALEESAETESLEPVKKRHVEELILDFRRSGADLDEEKQTRIRTIDNRLAEITQQFSENVLDSTNAWEMVIDDPELMKPFPQVVKEMARESARSKDQGSDEEPKWRFTLHAPSLLPFMKYMEDSDLRRQAWEASGRVGKQEPWNNSAIISEVLELRQEKAEILGFDQFADMIMERRMAKKGQLALDFLVQLRDSVFQSMQSEVAELEKFRAESLGLKEADALEPWDVAYWSEKLRKSRYDFDDENLRPYFSVDKVIDGLFTLAERLFGLRLVARPTVCGREADGESVEVWTEEVQYYDLYDQDSEEHLGGFYADWFPRESKRSGAWMDSLRSASFDENGNRKEKALGILCGNMTPGSSGEPAQLTHDEVETVFHEFGHLLHEMCGQVKVRYLNGISVPWDFVEVPSQIMENWCWERESLDLFARHKSTGEAIPEDLFEKMLLTRNFQKGLAVMRQLSFGKMDLDLHMHFSQQGKGESELDSFVDRSIADYRPRWKTPSPTILHRFGHLFSSGVGYAAGYYSYQWSEVLEADAFSRFREESVLNGDTGRSFRKEILSVGNSVDPMRAYISFRGRQPTLEAYLKRADMPVNESARMPFGTLD